MIPCSRGRIGILVNHNDAVPEAEMASMAPAGICIHAARFESPRAKGTDYTEAAVTMFAEATDVITGLEHLSRMHPDVVCLTYSAVSYLGGKDFDEELVSRANRDYGLRLTTAALATERAMTILGVVRPFIVVPPWFTADLQNAILRRLREESDPRGLITAVLPSGWAGMHPYELYEKGAQWEMDPARVLRQIRDELPGDADGIVVAGSGLMVAPIIEWLEEDCGRPVIASNQASLWHSLRTAQVRASVDGYGQLLRK